MSTKRKKSTTKATKSEKDARLQQRTGTKKFKPAVRNILFGNLVFLALAQWLEREDIISDPVATAMIVVSGALIVLAIYFQLKSDN